MPVGHEGDTLELIDIFRRDYDWTMLVTVQGVGREECMG